VIITSVFYRDKIKLSRIRDLWFLKKYFCTSFFKLGKGVMRKKEKAPLFSERTFSGYS